MTTTQKIYENKKHFVTVKTTETEYFGLRVTVVKDGITAFEGQTSYDFLDRMVKELELEESEFSKWQNQGKKFDEGT